MAGLRNGIFQGSNRLVETIMRGVQKGVSEKEGINIVDSDSLTRKIEFIHLNLLYIFFASNMKKTSDDDAH